MIGRTISHFRILAKIGEGGMGVVYEAEDEKLGRPVALKILPVDLAGDEERRLRLIREVRTAAAVNHPNIASIYKIDEAEGVTLVAMEFVEGKTLRANLIEHNPAGLALKTTGDSEGKGMPTRGERSDDEGAQVRVQFVGGHDHTGSGLPDLTSASRVEVDQIDFATTHLNPYRHRQSFSSNSVGVGSPRS